MGRYNDMKQNRDKFLFHMNIREERKQQNESCCGGNGPSCKCSNTRERKKNSMMEFFKSMKENFYE